MSHFRGIELFVALWAVDCGKWELCWAQPHESGWLPKP